jgi:GTPase
VIIFKYLIRLEVNIELIFVLFQSCLVSPTEEQYELLLKRLKERVESGRGETIYDIGVGEGMLKITVITQFKS